MHLTENECAMLDGRHGESVRQAIAQQAEVGTFGAERFVEVTNVHMMGDVDVMGEYGLSFLRGATRSGATAVLSLTANSRCVDLAWAHAFGQEDSVVGARSNFESGPAALAAALTGRTITEGWMPDASTTVHSGDLIEVDPVAREIRVLKRATPEQA